MKRFIEFLERNNAWENFERAIIEAERDVKRYKAYCRKFKNKELCAAFVWSESKEGREYWEKLNSKWVEENKSLKEQILSDD